MKGKKIKPNLMTLWNHYWFRPAPLFDLAWCRLIIVGFQIGYLVLKEYHEKMLEQ